jgi:hypothetical protein
MKKSSIYIAIISLGIGFTGCDKDFEEININPVLSETIDPSYIFSNAVVNSAFNTIRYDGAIVQQINTPFTGVLQGGNHNVWFETNNTGSPFNTLYSQPIKFLAEVIEHTKDDPERSNLFNMARIWRSYIFQVLVDTYGDVPYSESGKAYIEGVYLPMYDPQEAIYDDLLKEVSEAVVALDPGKTIESNEPLYQGDIAKWKKLGNSLLLRLGMRLSAVDAAKAEQYVSMATNPANGGLMESIADNALLDFNEIYLNPSTTVFNGSERANYYLGKPFVDYLKNTDDPRLQVIAVKYETPANPLETTGAAETNPENQNGMPFGYNEATISTAPNFPGTISAAWKYSQVNRRTLGRIDAPYFFISYAQTQLLLAEAAVRQWIQADPAILYNNGVRAHMNQMAQYSPSAAIPEASQDAYLAANPFNPAIALEQINNQYWVASFLNFPEAWANFRRSGFPELTPNPYPSADPEVKGDFIHRLLYPARERSVNEENYNAAVARMGEDNLATKIFWEP